MLFNLKDRIMQNISMFQTTAMPESRILETESSCRKKRLRIALVSYRSNPFCGGQGIYVSYLARALKELGHRVTVISGEPYPELDPEITLVPLPGMNFYDYPTAWAAIKDRGLNSFTDVLEYASYITGGFPEMYTFGRKLSRYMEKNGQKFDIVHDNQSLCYGLLDLLKTDVPVVTTIHHPITRDEHLALASEPKWYKRLLIRRWHRFLWMQKQVAPKIPCVITVSQCSKNDIIEDFKVAPEKFEVVYNGVDLEQFAPLPDVLRQPFRIMATASADIPLKGLSFLLEAVASLEETFPDICLTVLGKPKPNGPTESLMKDLGIAGRVQFVKGVTTRQLQLLYAKASLAVVPSLYEGFGLPVAEAMACGVPVISTTGGALPEVVGDAGILVPPGDAAAIAAAIKDLLLNPDLRAKLGCAGRCRMEKHFSWKEAAVATVNVYRNVMAQKVGYRDSTHQLKDVESRQKSELRHSLFRR
jgi:glycosyltransferase involved in cell wall biosynthesis